MHTQYVESVKYQLAETKVCSDRWKEEWPRIAKRLRMQKTQCRRQLWEKHRQTNRPETPQLPAPEQAQLDVHPKK